MSRLYPIRDFSAVVNKAEATALWIAMSPEEKQAAMERPWTPADEAARRNSWTSINKTDAEAEAAAALWWADQSPEQRQGMLDYHAAMAEHDRLRGLEQFWDQETFLYERHSTSDLLRYRYGIGEVPYKSPADIRRQLRYSRSLVFPTLEKRVAYIKADMEEERLGVTCPRCKTFIAPDSTEKRQRMRSLAATRCSTFEEMTEFIAREWERDTEAECQGGVVCPGCYKIVSG